MSHLFGKFGAQNIYGYSDITDLIDHMIEELCGFMERSSSLYIPTLSSLVAISIVVVNT